MHASASAPGFAQGCTGNDNLDAMLGLRESGYEDCRMQCEGSPGFLCLIIRIACEELHQDFFGGSSADISWVRGNTLDVSGLRLSVEVLAREDLVDRGSLAWNHLIKLHPRNLSSGRRR